MTTTKEWLKLPLRFHTEANDKGKVFAGTTVALGTLRLAKEHVRRCIITIDTDPQIPSLGSRSLTSGSLRCLLLEHLLHLIVLF